MTLRLPFDDLRPGPLLIPVLVPVGITVEVLEVVDRSGITEMAVIPGGRPAFESPCILRVGTSDYAIDVELEDEDGRRSGGELGQTGNRAEYRWRRWDHLGSPAALLIHIPASVVAQSSASTDPVAGALEHRSIDPGRVPDHWLVHHETLDLFAEMYAEAESDDRKAHGAKVVARLRRAITEREEAWPHEPGLDLSDPEDRNLRWGNQVLEEAMVAVAEAGIDHGIEPFIDAVRAVPYTGMVWNDIPLGVSHLHGCPHVPHDFEWPTWDAPGFEPNTEFPQLWKSASAAGEGPLTFLAQINLAEVPLPPSWPGPQDGWLLFFVDVIRLAAARFGGDPAVPGPHRVFYIPPEVEVTSRTPPWQHPVYARQGWREQGPPERMRYIGNGKTAWLTFDPIEVSNDDALRSFFGFRPRAESKPEVYDQVHEALESAHRERQHWLLGAPHAVQGEALVQALSGRWNDGEGPGNDPDDWLQLLQVASWDVAETFQDEVCKLHFFAHRDDVANGRFDRTLLTYQR
ncbi:MAG: YwqG family protein [Aquihabitans sp.]